MEKIILLFLNPETEFWFGGIGMSLMIELAKDISKRRENQKRCRQWNSTLENDIDKIKMLISQKRISVSKLQQGYFQYFNKYKSFLSQADIEMLIRKEPTTKDKMKEQLSVLLGLLEAVQLEEYIK